MEPDEIDAAHVAHGANQDEDFSVRFRLVVRNVASQRLRALDMRRVPVKVSPTSWGLDKKQHICHVVYQ